MTITTTQLKLSVGQLTLGVYEDQLCLCDWTYRRMRKVIDKRMTSFLQTGMQDGTHPLFEEVERQLTAYVAGDLKTFDLPLLYVGTPFQKQVWKALVTIPYGKTRSYMELATHLGDPSAVRAVASANGANALSIIVPCHRIIGSTGELVGYAGGLQVKKKLLGLEKSAQQLFLNL